jgi:hypothetical protein
LCTKFSTVANDRVWMLLRVLSAVVSAAEPWGRRTFVAPDHAAAERSQMQPKRKSRKSRNFKPF